MTDRELLRKLLLAVAVLATSAVMSQAAPAETDKAPIAIAIHAGAGVIRPENLSPGREKAIRDTLRQAVQAGHDVLYGGGAALDAVTAAIEILEDAPEFNAGRGSVLTAEGRIEMDASIMTGHDLNAGAVASVRGVRHPIRAARAVLEHSPHVMLVGRGAEAFARQRELRFMPDEWFMTEFRREQLERIRSREQGKTSSVGRDWRDSWFSTVGTVALDRDGNIAAGTSTGGTANKQFGRVGDSPIIGAGTYADNRSCAVSATGHGEFFIRHAVAYDVCARMRYGGQTLGESAEVVVNDVLVEAGGDGGVIALDTDGNIAMPFNTPGMYRAAIDRSGELTIALYDEE
jgi:beta-aspartyl-peptidase (threonine type)